MGLFPKSWFLNFCDMLFYFYFTLNSKGLVVVVIQDIKKYSNIKFQHLNETYLV